MHDSLIPTIPEGQKLITDQDKEFWDNLKSGLEEQVKKRLDKIQSIKPFPGSSVHVAKAVILPKTQLGLGAFPCHLCNKSYEKKATLEKHIAGQSYYSCRVSIFFPYVHMTGKINVLILYYLYIAN